MIKTAAFLISVIIFQGVLSSDVWAGRNGKVSSKYISELNKFVGSYEGIWLNDLTSDTYDDISHQKLGKIILNLKLDTDQKLTAHFYQNLDSLEKDQKLDLLGKSCHSSVGELISLGIEKHAAGDKSNEILTANFKFNKGDCNSRVLPTEDNNLTLYLYIDAETGQPVIQTMILQTYKHEGQVYLMEKGVAKPVEIKRVHDPEAPYIRQSLLYYCMEEDYKVQEDCTEIKKELKNIFLPFPVVGVLWIGYTKGPKFKVNSKHIPVYHEGIFKLLD